MQCPRLQRLSGGAAAPISDPLIRGLPLALLTATNRETYASAEHFMMAAKALLFGDVETAGRIREAPHPEAAKALGREVRGFDEQLWASQ